MWFRRHVGTIAGPGGGGAGTRTRSGQYMPGVCLREGLVMAAAFTVSTGRARLMQLSCYLLDPPAASAPA